MEVLKERSTVQELAQKIEISEQQIYQKFAEEKEEHLLKVIRQQKIELDFFKERLAIILLTKQRLMISKNHSTLSLSKQCKLLKLHRSVLYYKPKGKSKLNLELMKLIDAQYMYYCFKDAGRIYTWLNYG